MRRLAKFRTLLGLLLGLKVINVGYGISNNNNNHSSNRLIKKSNILVNNQIHILNTDEFMDMISQQSDRNVIIFMNDGSIDKVEEFMKHYRKLGELQLYFYDNQYYSDKYEYGQVNDNDIVCLNRHNDKLYINVKKVESEKLYQQILSFMDCPKIIQIKNYQKENYQNYQMLQENVKLFKKELEDLQNDRQLVVTYIPEEQKYKQKHNKELLASRIYYRNQIIDLKQLEKTFRYLRYQYLLSNSDFYIIKNYDFIRQLGINISKQDIGRVFIIRKQDQFKQNSHSFEYQNHKYYLHQIGNDVNTTETENDVYKSHESILHKMYQFYLNNYSVINDQQDMLNVLRASDAMVTQQYLVYYKYDIRFNHQINKLMNIHKIMQQHKNVQLLFINDCRLIKQFFNIEIQSNEQPQLYFIDQTYKTQQKIPENYQYKLTTPHVIDQYSYYINKYGFDKITKQKLLRFVDQCYNHSDTHFQCKTDLQISDIKLCWGSQIINQLNKSKYNLVYFYRGQDNCKFREVIDKFDGLVKQLQQQEMQNINSKTEVNDYDRSQLRNTMRINNLEHFKQLQIMKYNILNESQDMMSPTVSPLLLYIYEGGSLVVDLKKQRLDLEDSDRILQILIKLVDQNQYIKTFSLNINP